MLYALQIVTVMLIALAMALSLAHALEYPGKLRLRKETYLAVQAIYYPGFTIGGIGEMLGVVCALAAALLSPRDGAQLWWWIAFAAMLLTHLTYWLVTHPVNNFWVRDVKLSRAGAGFFALDFLTPASGDWKALRDRWEISHIVRAIFATFALLAAVIAVSA